MPLSARSRSGHRLVSQVRFNDPEASAAVDGEVRRIARERSVPGLQLAVSGGERRPPRQSDADQPLYERAAGIARRLNLRIGAVHRWSSADVGFVPADVPALDGLGPIGSGERTADEYVLRSSLVERAVLLANLMLECGGTRCGSTASKAGSALMRTRRARRVPSAWSRLPIRRPLVRAVEMLEQGGNAIDAACAAGIAIGVCEPQASGLGGQSIGLIHFGGRTFAVDGSSRVPSLSHIDRMSPGDKLVGHRATTVPSTLATYAWLHEHYGRLPWRELLAPAIRIAREGYRITELQQTLLERSRDELLMGLRLRHPLLPARRRRSPGAKRIFSTVGQFLSNVIDRSQTIREAMEEPRLHCSIGGQISLKQERFDPAVPNYLSELGYTLLPREPYAFYLGCIQAVLRRQSAPGFQGVADVRRDGSAAGPSPRRCPCSSPSRTAATASPPRSRAASRSVTTTSSTTAMPSRETSTMSAMTSSPGSAPPSPAPSST